MLFYQAYTVCLAETFGTVFDIDCLEFVCSYKLGATNLFSLRDTKPNSGESRAPTLKGKKTLINSQGNNYNSLMKHLIMFAITKRHNIRI